MTNSRLQDLLKQSKRNELQKKFLLKEARSIFTSSEPVPYAQSASYNLYIRFHSVQRALRYCDTRINLRELLNLFIADGFFKSQTNYMNSKLSLSDIESMCQYMTFKIRDQNFLDISQIAFAPASTLTPLVQETVT